LPTLSRLTEITPLVQVATSELYRTATGVVGGPDGQAKPKCLLMPQTRARLHVCAKVSYRGKVDKTHLPVKA
jgi:hypothetical protein